MNKFDISVQTLRRLPDYLNYLHGIAKKEGYISATSIAAALNLNNVQVRKDLAYVSNAGRPRKGYPIEVLIKDLESFLGYHDVDSAVIVGAGHLGKALLHYSGFQAYGLKILAAFDNNEKILSEEKSGSIFHIDRMKEICSELKPKIGIIAVPAQAAQQVCDLLTECGVKAIWNFAPVHIAVSNNILVVNENMAAHLAMLSIHLRRPLEQSADKEINL
ncbi:redox-sensing transcriptional repressor Rex [bacterium]|nr:redox-sensing transcriptional repressor Rex [bacterium]